MAVNAESQFPVSKRPSWLLLCTGGLLASGGIGWCLRLAYAKEPKMTIVAYLAGSAGICLTNTSFFYRPVKTSSVPNWIMLLTGGILSGTGFGYCLTIAMKEHPKSATIAYIVGSLGYTVVNSVVCNLYTIVFGLASENCLNLEGLGSSYLFLESLKSP
ncbi:hypothetical protein AVEN_10383-1 [Araneus ventricosus]|uniref:Uncharacterized protein n=1 Tax=Araneus ventricosus TaxID=182803 RepID=A0A4Y2GVP1_ARAVE|nr:hypothetical protein AVEN_10383-1 [Araneus ventricosus]